jgi:hypothetical protein
LLRKRLYSAKAKNESDDRNHRHQRNFCFAARVCATEGSTLDAIFIDSRVYSMPPPDHAPARGSSADQSALKAVAALNGAVAALENFYLTNLVARFSVVAECSALAREGKLEAAE